MKQVLGAAILAFVLGLGIWYLQNIQATSIISGVVSSAKDVLKNDGGRTNIMLLGIGGEGHEGGELTDSMLFVSFDLEKNTALMIPIPRDIWIPSLKAKINTAYFYGNKDQIGGGIDNVKIAVSEILGVPIHYVVRLDFQGFVKAIDAVGGIDIEVSQTFDDYKYPIPGKENAEPEALRYEHVHFEKGNIHMDGATALKYARSRHALGDEGTDFARSARQQKVILAFKDKVLSTSTIFSKETIDELKSSIITSIDTDIGSAEQGSFLKLFLGLGSKDNLSSIEITNFLESPKNIKDYGGQWVLVPTPNLSALQSYVKTQLAK